MFQDTIDFVAFVAKDIKDWRACYVLECGEGELAQDVITTIGQAFDLRFKQFLTKPAPVLSSNTRDEREYYNDLPGKSPPESGPPPVPPLPANHDHRNRGIFKIFYENKHSIFNDSFFQRD